MRFIWIKIQSINYFVVKLNAKPELQIVMIRVCHDE